MKRRTLTIGIITLLLLLLPATAVVADTAIPGDCLDTVDIGGFTVCLAGYDDNGDGTTTWTYAVQSDDQNSTSALSHLDIELCPTTYPYVEPGNGETYSTPAVYRTFNGREGIEYTVQIGIEPSTYVSGLKFEGGEPNLGEDGVVEVDIFQFTLPTKNIGVGQISFGIKASDAATGSILGPVFEEGANSDAPGEVLIESCEEPTAVRLVSLQASNWQSSGPSILVRLLRFFGLR